jgi:enamine deaminase RidA (YjgF/YER057c/UK114 family)
MVGTVDADGNTLDNEDDMGDQTTNALARVGQVLAEHGASPHSIITSVSILFTQHFYWRESMFWPKCDCIACGVSPQTLYVTDMAKKPAMNEAWAQWFKPHAVPARATIEIDSLGAKRLIEVCAVAAIVSSSKL